MGEPGVRWVQMLQDRNRISWKVDLALRCQVENSELLDHVGRVGPVNAINWQTPEPAEKRGTRRRPFFVPVSADITCC